MELYPAHFAERLVSGMSDAIVYADAEGLIRVWNRGATRVFGFEEAEAVGRSLDIIVPENLRERHWQGYRDTMRTGQSRYGDGQILSVPAVRKDGTRVSVEFTIVPFSDGFLRDDLEAKEAVHDGYVSAFTHLDGFRGRSSLATWLARIVSNEALARLRRRRSTVDIGEMSEILAADVGPFTTAEPTPEQAIARREIRNAIQKAVDELPPNFRSVFMLRAIEQMSVEETASYLGIPRVTVKTRFHRANKLLRQALTTQFGAIFDDMYLFLGARCDRLVATVLHRIAMSAETGSTVPHCDRPPPCRTPP
jgi:RNA polymerase sigma-70 factor, ECF subfamily